MIDFITGIGVSQYLFLILGAFLLGIDKAGLRGVGIVAVPIYASLFGGRHSAAVILPILFAADIWAVYHYRKHITFYYLKKMLPPALVGLICGMFLGTLVSDRIFTIVIACLVLLCLLIMLLQEFGVKKLELPDHPIAHAGAGFGGGFSSMVGNAAGPIMTIYLLSLRLPKEVFIGTGAVFFLIINFCKFPVHLFVWNSMTTEGLTASLSCIPFVWMGLFLGLKIVRRVPDTLFRRFIMIATCIGSIKLFFP